MPKGAIVFRFEVNEFDSFYVLQLCGTADAVATVEEIRNGNSFVFSGDVDANVGSKGFYEWSLFAKMSRSMSGEHISTRPNLGKSLGFLLNAKVWKADVTTFAPTL